MYYIETTGTKDLTFNEDSFLANAAVSGASVYCDDCSWTLIKNTLQNSIAY